MKQWIVIAEKTILQILAAKELRRYLYAIEGKMPEIKEVPEITEVLNGEENVFLLMRAEQLPISFREALEVPEGEESYRIKNIRSDGKNRIFLTGSSDLAVLYAVYDFLETRGMRFYLHGDVYPERRAECSAFDVEIDRKGRPLFAVRGILPFHDFPEGPDWWSKEEYLSAVAQLTKMRANFIGMHTYPEKTGTENNLTAEPLVWIGKKENCDEEGNVKVSYPAQHFKTNGGSWGYHAMRTKDYPFGVGQVFEKEVYCADYMDAYPEENYWEELQKEPDPEKYNALFNGYGSWLRETFQFAHMLGVKTCVGTETPLLLPAALKKGPAREAEITEFYEGIFERIKRKYPLDYYWLWTPEEWTWRGNRKEETEETIRDIRCALEAGKRVEAPFSLAMCGWTLGPQEDRALFDSCFPKNMPFSCINRNVGFEPLEPKFADLKDRPAWAIPWLEDDPAITSVQLWAGRVRKDAYDAKRLGCEGLIGIHWRTRSTAPSMKAMMEAAWSQEAWEEQVIESRAQEGFCGQKSLVVKWKDQKGIFSSAREGMESYELSIPSGLYTVSLYMRDAAGTRVGERVFDILVNGKKIGGIDPYERGGTEGVCIALENVDVGQNRVLEIRFLPVKGSVIVSGICVEGITNNNQLAGDAYSRKIDCGGEGFGEFEADLSLFEGSGREAPTKDFYETWAKAEFGQKAGDRAAGIFRQIDGKLPRPARWLDGPGNLFCNPVPWETERELYRFVDAFSELEPFVCEPECRERFRYWQNTFLALRLSGKTGCLWGSIRRAAEKGDREKVRRSYKELTETICQLERSLLLSLETSGEMGVLANLQQRSLVPLLRECQELLSGMGMEIPKLPELEIAPCSRLALPWLRTTMKEGEHLRLKVIVIGGAEKVVLHYKELGGDGYQQAVFESLGGWVFGICLPEKIKEDLEYHITAEGGEYRARFPAEGTGKDQSVVVFSDIKPFGAEGH